MFKYKLTLLFSFRLDQALYKAIQLSSPQTEFYRSLIQHVSNQFYFHLASVIMKSAKNVICLNLKYIKYKYW